MTEYTAYEIAMKKGPRLWNLEKEGELFLEYQTREQIRGWLSQNMEPGDEFLWEIEKNG